MKNTGIRIHARDRGVFLWQIAEALGITDSTFSRWLRRELPEKRKQEIMALIDEIAAEV